MPKSNKGVQFTHGIFALLFGNPRFFDTYFHLLKPEYFTVQAEGILFKAVQRYVERYEAGPGIAEITLYIQRNQRFLADEILELLAGLPSAEETSERFYTENMLEFVKEIELGNAIRESQDDILSGDFAKVVERIEAAQTKVLAVEGEPPSWTEGLAERVKYMTTKFQDDRIPTGMQTIDHNTQGGLRFGQVGLVAADYGGGKSVLLLNIARAALFAKRKVLFVTLTCELDKTDQELRFDCLMTRIPVHEYGDRADEVIRQIATVRQVGGDIKFVEWANDRSTLYDLEALLARLSRKRWHPDVVIIDYLDLIKPAQQERSEWTEIENLWRQFRTVAKRHRFVGWSASQLNADEDVAKSKGKKGVIDVGFKILHTPPERELNYCRVVNFKNRNGITGFIVPVHRDGPIFEMTEADMTYEQYKEHVRLDDYYAQLRGERKAQGGRK
ncbi:MAG: DnaB-like helicase C-terminal domain-containing protein [Thermotogota bacterium]